MTALQAQLQHLRQEIHCTATLEYSSPHVRVCSVALPWCGRQLRWQLLFGPPSSTRAPDVVFDDESFRPLCGPSSFPSTAAASTSTAHHPHHVHGIPPYLSPGGTGGSGRSDSVTSASSASAAAAAGCSPAALRLLLRRWSTEPHRPDGLTRLVAVLLEAYGMHQRARLEAAAVQLPRLHFELSTLESGAGVQMELQQQQACFTVPLSVDLRRLLELAEQLGAVLPPGLKMPAVAAAPPAPQAQQAAQLPGQQQHQDALTAGARGGGGRGADNSEDNDVLEPLEGEEGEDRNNNMQGAAATAGAAGVAAAGQEQPIAATEEMVLQPPPLVLQAAFRLPAGGGAGDLTEPELTLQIPPALLELQAQSTASYSSASSSSAPLGSGGSNMHRSGSTTALSSSSAAFAFPTTPTTTNNNNNNNAGSSSAGGSPATAATAAAAGHRPTIGVSLLPAFLLPLWSAHMCLAEFVPLASERLRVQIDAHCSTLSTRQQLLSFLTEMLGPPLELNLGGGSALFSVAWEGAAVLLGLELGPKFPSDKPGLVLTCVRQLNSPDATRTYRDYPWSPRWPPREMAARIHNWLQEELPNFLRTRAAPP